MTLGVAERGDDYEAAARAVARERQAAMWTSLPATVVKFDAGRQTADVQPTVQAYPPTADGMGAPVNMPVCLDCPIVYPRGGGWAMTFPLNVGDEVLVSFSARCIDAWWQSGGVQPQAEMRMHDLSDGFVIPGPTSQPRKLSSVLANGIELRSEDGSTHLRMTPNMVDILGALHVSGAITADSTIAAQGNVTSQADVLAQTVSLHNHIHLLVKAGTDTSGGPKP